MIVEKQIVVPGEIVNEKIYGYTYGNAEKRAMVYGMLYKKGDSSKIVPLKTKYLPEIDDVVIGIVTSVKHGGVIVDLNSPYDGFVVTRREYNYKDIIMAKIMRVDEVKNVGLMDDKKLFDGELIEISPSRIPRVIGKRNSMLNLIKDKTGCMIFIGKNGRVWIKGGNSLLAKKAVLEIECNAHTSGLTEKITHMLEQEQTVAPAQAQKT
ncbi:MAG: KH domain-containing protein [Candidatus Micrarchaeota archaeon]